jgi:hypothetical protein
LVAQQIQSKLKDAEYPEHRPPLADRMMRRSGATRRKPVPALLIALQATKRNSMDRLVIRGGRRIEGSVQIRGAKNAALPPAMFFSIFRTHSEICVT